VLGLIGALLAIPIAATIQAVVSELLEERAERINGTAPDSQMLGAPDT
jgi:predicted PurR-regulated permease PerM